MTINVLPPSPSGQVTHNDVRGKVNEIIVQSNTKHVENEIIVKTPQDLDGVIDSTKVYLIDGVIDFTGTGVQISVPAGGISLRGLTSEVSKLMCSDSDYELFIGGSVGNVLIEEVKITVNGVNSKVYDLTDSDGTHVIEVIKVNYENCSSLGEVTNFLQILEAECPRIGGTPEWTLSGTMSGVRIVLSFVRFINNIDALFKAGPGLTFSGRFITDINCDLPAVGALIDFSESNFLNDQELVLQGALITRGGVVDLDLSSISPNIDQNSNKSNWRNNTGLPDTQGYFRSICATEVPTVISSSGVYYPLSGEFTVSDAVQFSMPVNGEFEMNVGFGAVQLTGDLIIDGDAGDDIDLRVTKSVNGGTTWPEELNHIRRPVNNLSGGRNVAFFSLNFIAKDLKKGDRLRLEVENKSSSKNVTMELDSYVILTKL